MQFSYCTCVTAAKPLCLWSKLKYRRTEEMELHFNKRCVVSWPKNINTKWGKSEQRRKLKLKPKMGKLDCDDYDERTWTPPERHSGQEPRMTFRSARNYEKNMNMKHEHEQNHKVPESWKTDAQTLNRGLKYTEG